MPSRNSPPPTKPSAEMTATNPPQEADAEAYEIEHVHSVYSEIAPHFSATRHTPWPQVVDFIDSLADDATLLLDLGCGNGKYLASAAKRRGLTIATDMCRPLLEIAARDTAVAAMPWTDFATCDSIALPLHDDCADAALCIAVLHHFSTRVRRVAALRELARVLRPYARALIYVWALERQPSTIEPRTKMVSRKFDTADVLVPWHMRRPKDNASSHRILGDWHDVHKRYYHVYCEGELESEVDQVASLQTVKSYYDHQNWCVVVQKVAGLGRVP